MDLELKLLPIRTDQIFSNVIGFTGVFIRIIGDLIFSNEYKRKAISFVFKSMFRLFFLSTCKTSFYEYSSVIGIDYLYFIFAMNTYPFVYSK